MLQLASRLFADVDVGKKLFAGFALVLLLTVAVTASGFMAVRAVLQAHERVERLTAVNLHIMQARRLERSFAIEQSAESASRVRDSLQRLNEQLEQLAVSSTQSQRRAVSEMQQAAEEYRQQFDRYVQLQEGAREARLAMGQAAAEARGQFEVVELDMYDAVRELIRESSGMRGTDPLALAETASGLSKRMLDLRGQENLFILDGSAEALS